MMPDVQLVTHRPSVGRLSISRPPSLEVINEKVAGAATARTKDGEELSSHTVTLKRSVQHSVPHVCMCMYVNVNANVSLAPCVIFTYVPLLHVCATHTPST